MMRSLWTAASGMTSQQTSVDTIANNLANVNSVGYKQESTQFKSLLYQDLQSKTTTANVEQKPVAAQVGLGTRVSSITSYFTQGPLNATDSDTDFAIIGDGFFAVTNLDGDTVYTRNGNLYMATATEGMMLATAEGYPVLDVDGQQIILDDTYQVSSITISTEGELLYPDEDSNPQPIGYKIALYQFTNPSGLDKLGTSYYAETEASGVPISEEYDGVTKKSSLKQGYLEASNVQVATEMVNLITAQRAYELCSKAITTSDTMMEQANNLKR
ncbi:flagellar hook-basal body protein [Lachnospira multipara]|uniref:Flagellar basal-body rod protein FlgG n=1 Tax=Lachnospira multipara TaxID=28051 RepID=A0A1H5STC0_9FIRM|nr:flagellar hook-basal body protein [Lachnospira multipara]SEF53806.1 flagellar basal-body rod protein FlgG [Lachnospira multipara]